MLIDATIDAFGSVVSKYTMTESVKDGIIVNFVMTCSKDDKKGF